MNILSLLMVFILMCFGAFEHWRMMANEKRVAGSFKDYLFSQYPGHTYGTYAALMVAAWLATLAGAGDFLNPLILGKLFNGMNIDAKLAASITAAAGASIAAGYAFDSRFNKANQVASVLVQGEPGDAEAVKGESQ
jgi:hypothetical protein